MWPRASTSSDLNKRANVQPITTEIVVYGEAVLGKEGQFGLNTPCE